MSSKDGKIILISQIRAGEENFDSDGSWGLEMSASRAKEKARRKAAVETTARPEPACVRGLLVITNLGCHP